MGIRINIHNRESGAKSRTNASLDLKHCFYLLLCEESARGRTISLLDLATAKIPVNTGSVCSVNFDVLLPLGGAGWSWNAIRRILAWFKVPVHQIILSPSYPFVTDLKISWVNFLVFFLGFGNWFLFWHCLFNFFADPCFVSCGSWIWPPNAGTRSRCRFLLHFCNCHAYLKLTSNYVLKLRELWSATLSYGKRFMSLPVKIAPVKSKENTGGGITLYQLRPGHGLL
jgi:hypothetical protein